MIDLLLAQAAQTPPMVEKLGYLVPEIILFTATVLVMMLGLSPRATLRSAVGFVAVGSLALAFVGWLASPLSQGFRDGMAERALREALDHAVRREQFGRPIAEFQLVQEKLGRMAMELTAARILVYRAAYEKDLGAERITTEAAMAKAYATEAAQRIIDDAVQILGGRGVMADHEARAANVGGEILCRVF